MDGWATAGAGEDALTGGGTGAGDVAGLTVMGSGAGDEVAPGLAGRDGCRGDFAPDNSADDGERVEELGVSTAAGVGFEFSVGGSFAGEDTGEDAVAFA